MDQKKLSIDRCFLDIVRSFYKNLDAKSVKFRFWLSFLEFRSGQSLCYEL